MVVTEATHISGSLLSHMCILKSICLQIIVESIIRSVYFTNHEAVKVILQRI